MANVTAQWTVELNCDCPCCGEFVNLLDYVDFWDGKNMSVGEDKKGVSAHCPKCDHDFDVDCEY